MYIRALRSFCRSHAFFWTAVRWFIIIRPSHSALRWKLHPASLFLPILSAKAHVLITASGTLICVALIIRKWKETNSLCLTLRPAKAGKSRHSQETTNLSRKEVGGGRRNIASRYERVHHREGRPVLSLSLWLTTSRKVNPMHNSKTIFLS